MSFPALEVTIPGRAAVLTAPKAVADNWKWQVARAVGDAWRGGQLREPCAIHLTFDLPAPRFQDTALANLLKATIDGLANQIFAPAPAGQPGPWSREDWRITELHARKRLVDNNPAVGIRIAPPAQWPAPPGALLADVTVPGRPPLYPGDQTGVGKVRDWREAFATQLAATLHQPLPDAATARLGAAFDFVIEHDKMEQADLDNFCHPAALAIGALLLGEKPVAQHVVTFRATKRAAATPDEIGTRVRLWREG